MERIDAFETYHPLVTLAFFVCAISFGMFVRHPAFQLASVLCSAAYCISAKGYLGLRWVAAMVPLFAALAAINPLLNTMGDTVLFTYCGGRRFTWEALAFGMSTGAMFVSMMMWFVNCSSVMTGDKISYLFGGAAPALSLVLTMTIRLVPTYRHRIARLYEARKGIGKASDDGSMMTRLKGAASLLSALLTWALEGSVATADSMRCRGYGLPGRTQFRAYRFDRRDRVLLFVLAVLACATAASISVGAASAEYLPKVVLAELSASSLAGLISYATMLALPALINLREDLHWRISLSRI